VLTKCRLINEVIVVSDGSTDDTVKIALQFDGVQVVELPENRGKGGAMKAGLEQTAAEIVLFLDADLNRINRRSCQRAPSTGPGEPGPDEPGSV